MALFISLCSERSDADRALVAAPALSSPALLFVLSQNLKLAHKNLAPGSPRNGALTAPRPEGPPFLAQAFLPLRSLRMDSPCISRRWALCTSRSRMLSAKVGSPICSCHLATGSWLVRIVERV